MALVEKDSAKQYSTEYSTEEVKKKIKFTSGILAVKYLPQWTLNL